MWWKSLSDRCYALFGDDAEPLVLDALYDALVNAQAPTMVSVDGAERRTAMHRCWERFRADTGGDRPLVDPRAVYRVREVFALSGRALLRAASETTATKRRSVVVRPAWMAFDEGLWSVPATAQPFRLALAEPEATVAALRALGSAPSPRYVVLAGVGLSVEKHARAVAAAVTAATRSGTVLVVISVTADEEGFTQASLHAKRRSVSAVLCAALRRQRRGIARGSIVAVTRCHGTLALAHRLGVRSGDRIGLVIPEDVADGRVVGGTSLGALSS